MPTKGVNKAIILGNLGANPEVRYTPSGTAVANLSVATSEFWQDRQTGERHENTEWHRLVLFNRLAEVAGEFLSKGSKVYVEGRIQTRKWQDRDGHDRYTTEIVVNDLQMLDGRSQQGGNAGQGRTQPGAQPTNETAGSGGSGGSAGASGPPDDFDDDIPF